MSGRRFRVFAVKGIFTREAVCLFVDRSIPGESVARKFNRAIADRGVRPVGTICDIGTEFTGKANTSFLIIPSTTTGADIRTSQLAARGAGYKSRHLVHEKNLEAVGLKFDTNGDGALEATDETVTKLTLSSW